MTASLKPNDATPDWDLVRLAEVSPAALAERVSSEVDRGQRDYTPPEVGDLVSARVRTVQENAHNRARMVRFSDYVLPGEAVVEVGCGAGFVAAQLLAGGAGSYRAMDLEASCVRRTTRLLDALGLQERVGPIVEQDLYTLVPEDLAGASLVICSEVIEHVPDPEGALTALARALPEGADLLFSVPILGRLETVWGHLSIFTVDRLQDMLAGAGLEARHVEPLADRWTVLLAGHPRPVPPEDDARLEQIRVGAQHYAPVERVAEFPEVQAQPTRFQNVSIDSVTVSPVRHTRSTRVATSAADSDTGRISTEITSGRSLLRRPTSGGVALFRPGTDPILGIRLELAFDSLAEVRQVTVAFRGPGAATAGTWTWKPTDKDRKRKGPRKFALRPGADPSPFTGPRSADLTNVDRVEVSATVPAGGSVSFTIARVTWTS